MSDTKDITTTESTDIAPKPSGPPVAAVGPLGIEVTNLETMWWLACRVCQSNLAPKDCKTPEDIFVRAQHGMAAGMNFMQSVQYVSNVNGRPCIWGPPLKGLILASGKCESWVEEIIGDDPFKDNFAIKITVTRKDMPGEQVVRFSTADAKRAGLMSRDTYKSYPEDMLLYRCSSRVAKRHFPDVISGLVIAEDSGDIIDVQALSAEDVGVKPTTLDEVAEQAAAKLSPKKKNKPKEKSVSAPTEEPVPDPETGEVPDDGDADMPIFGSDDDGQGALI